MFIQQGSKNQVYKFKAIGGKQIIISTYYFDKYQQLIDWDYLN